MKSQVTLLQDKREKGIQEIQKLNKMIDNLKNGKPIMTGITNEPTSKKPLQESAPNITTQPKNSTITSNIITQFAEIKKSLEQLYKDVIIALSEQKISEFSETPDKKSVTKGSDNLIKIEKRVNDIILMIQEYIELMK